MVIPVGPGKFYGSSLPRPRYFTNVTLNSQRVDPPVSVLDPLLSWASEAHWSMGGLSFTRLRLQGRIEGNVNKLRAERERIARKHHRSAGSVAGDVDDDELETKFGISRKRTASVSVSVSPPPAPMAAKRRRFMALLDEDEDKVVEKGSGVRKSVRKLGDDFDRVASEKPVGSGLVKGSSPVRTRSRSSEPESVDDLVMKVVQEVKGKKLRSGKKGKGVGSSDSSSPTSSTRSSPRLAKRG